MSIRVIQQSTAERNQETKMLFGKEPYLALSGLHILRGCPHSAAAEPRRRTPPAGSPVGWPTRSPHGRSADQVRSRPASLYSAL